MWQQNYSPVANSVAWSSVVAALPVASLLYAIGIRRVSAWKSSLLGLAAAALVAAVAYHMPALLVMDAALYGAAFGAFPIFWVIYWAIVLYRLTVETGKFEVLRNSIGHLTADRGVQALLQRRYAVAIEILSNAVSADSKLLDPRSDERLLLGLSQQRAGDVAG